MSIKYIDKQWRVVIPIEMREHVNIDPGDKVVFRVEDNAISVKKVYINCVFCGQRKDQAGKTMLKFLHRRPYCTNCEKELTAQLQCDTVQKSDED